MPAPYVPAPQLELKREFTDASTATQNKDEEAEQQWIIHFDDTMTSSSDDEGEGNRNNQWYVRNDTALKDIRQMRKLVLGRARIGLDMVAALQTSAASKKKVDVTGKRRERKSVLPQNVWGEVQQQLKEEGIELINREKAGAAEGRTNATMTYYGTSAVFYNHQVRTKIRMRIRYYLSYVRLSDGTLTDVQREGATQTNGYLELKVKSPRAFEENSVDKYRLLVSDALISQLVNLDANQGTFLNQLELLKQAIQNENTEQSALIDTMFNIMGDLARRKPAFLRPSLVVSYERSAYKYVEKDYPVPVKSNPNHETSPSKTSKKNRLRKAIQWRRRNWGRRATSPPLDGKPVVDRTETNSTEGQHDELESLTTADGIFFKNTNSAVEHHDIEYQFTIDRNVRAHYPLLPKPGVLQMPVAEHFDVSNYTELMRYPVEARVIEFKEPLVVAELPKKDRSKDHETFVRVLVSKMQSLIMWGDYDANIGKYGNLRSRLVQEHKTNRIKNEYIEIDFTGKGEYQQQN